MFFLSASMTYYKNRDKTNERSGDMPRRAGRLAAYITLLRVSIRAAKFRPVHTDRAPEACLITQPATPRSDRVSVTRR